MKNQSHIVSVDDNTNKSNDSANITPETTPNTTATSLTVNLPTENNIEPVGYAAAHNNPINYDPNISNVIIYIIDT